MPLSALLSPLTRLFTGKPEEPPHRDDAERARVDTECARLALYQFQTCPYCVKVRRAIARLDLTIELRDIRREPEYRDELVREGGLGQVPCLRIEEGDGTTRWLYESYDIVNYLQGRFGAGG